MRYFEVILDTPSDLIELRCSELETLGVSGFIIEDEADFRSFLERKTGNTGITWMKSLQRSIPI